MSEAIEQGEQVGTLVGDENAMQVAMGNVGTLPSADELVRSLTSMSDVKVVSFLASDVNAQNLGWMQRVARAALPEPRQVISALTVPTPLGPATVSLTTTRTASCTVTTYSLSAHNELLQTLKAMSQQHAELPMQLSKEFAKIVQRLLDVHRSTAMGTSSGPAKSLLAPVAKPHAPRPENGSHSTQAKSPTPLPTPQPSPAGMGTDSSGAAYATPAGSVSDGVEAVEADMTPARPMNNWAIDMWEQEVAPQLMQPGVKMTISTSGGISRASSTPSPIVTGKPKAVLEALRKNQEAEAKRKKVEAKAKAKAEKEKEKETSSSSSTDLEISSSEEEEPAPKTQAKKKGQKKPTQKAMVKTP